MPELIDPSALPLEASDAPIRVPFVGAIEEWHTIVQARTNVLIHGNNCLLEQTFVVLHPYLRGHVLRWNRADSPPIPAGQAVLLVDHLDDLTGAELLCLGE